MRILLSRDVLLLMLWCTSAAPVRSISQIANFQVVFISLCPSHKKTKLNMHGGYYPAQIMICCAWSLSWQ